MSSNKNYMNYKVLIIMSLIAMQSYCQDQNTQFYFDISEYEKIANDSLIAWYYNESWYFENINPAKGEYLGSEVFNLDELNIKSIPIIGFKNDIEIFECSMKFIDMLDFNISDPLNQLVLIYSNDNIFVCTNHIFSFNNDKQYLHYYKNEKIAPIGTGQVYLLDLIVYDFKTPVFNSPLGIITIIDNEIFFIKSENFTENSITYKLIHSDFYINEILGEEAINFKIQNDRLPPTIIRKPCKNKTNYIESKTIIKKFEKDYFEKG